MGETKPKSNELTRQTRAEMSWERTHTHDREKVFETTSELEKLRTDNVMTDVALDCDDGQLRAHKCVLSAGCLYFRAVLANRPGGGDDTKIHLHGVTATGLDHALRYIYTGRYPTDVDNDANALKSVLVASDVLQLPALVSYCRQNLVRNLKLENCLEVLDVSTLTLEGDEMQKFAGQHFDKLQHTNTFLELTSDGLVRLVTCAKSFQSPDVIVYGVIRWAKHDLNARKCDVMAVMDKVEVDDISDECFHMLGREPFVVDVSRDFFSRLYRAATTRLVKEHATATGTTKKSCRSGACTTSESCVEACAHVKLDFIGRGKNKLNYVMHTYYYADNVWSDAKSLSKITSADLLAFFGAGNFIYYFEKVANDCRTLHRLHADAGCNECLLFPYERYELHSAVDFRNKIYLHVANKLVCCDLSCCTWEVLNTQFPNSASTLLTCCECVWCVCWNQCVMQFVPDAKVVATHDMALSGCCGVKCAPSSGVIYFCGEDSKHEGRWNALDCTRVEWMAVELPDGIGQLGESWRLCAMGKELPCLFFIDNYSLLWEFYPKMGFWKRVSDDVKFVEDLVAIVARM